MDPTWRDFVEQCKKAIALMRSFGERLQRTMKENVQASGGLKEELEKALGEDPVHVSEALLGRVIPEGEWWQYLKDLAYEHPAAALFVARQVVGEKEILVPRFPLDSPVAQALGLASAV